MNQLTITRILSAPVRLLFYALCWPLLVVGNQFEENDPWAMPATWFWEAAWIGLLILIVILLRRGAWN